MDKKVKANTEVCRYIPPGSRQPVRNQCLRGFGKVSRRQVKRQEASTDSSEVLRLPLTRPIPLPSLPGTRSMDRSSAFRHRARSRAFGDRSEGPAVADYRTLIGNNVHLSAA